MTVNTNILPTPGPIELPSRSLMTDLSCHAFHTIKFHTVRHKERRNDMVSSPSDDSSVACRTVWPKSQQRF